MRWVGEAKQVMAMGKTFTKMRYDPANDQMHPVRIPDHLDVIAEMACGAQAHFGLSQVSGLAPGIEMILYGSEGTLRYHNSTLSGGQRGDESLQPLPIPTEEKSGWRVEADFINAIRKQETIKLTSFEDGVKYMEFTEAVARSLAEGVAVSLPL